MTRIAIAALAALALMSFLAAIFAGLALASHKEREPGASLGRPDHVYVVRPGEPMSTDGAIDIDGRIPEYLVCGTRYLGDYAYDPDTGQGVIRYNICAIRRSHHSVALLRETIEHERAHARGYDHRESTARRNPAFYP